MDRASSSSSGNGQDVAPAKPLIKGWCPGALRPMASGDGWLVRVRPRAGRLTSAQAAGVARLSLRFGNGWLDLTGRANLQLRGVAADAHAALLDDLHDLDLLDADAEAEGRRNIVVTPFWAAGDGTQALALSLADALAAPDASRLPPKFGFAVDLGSAAVLRSTPASVRIERGPGGLVVRADNRRMGELVDPARAADAALALARRLTGSAPDDTAARPSPTRGPITDALPPTAAPARVGATRFGWLAALAFGELRAETLLRVAALGALRLTPWRMLLIEGLADAPDVDGLIAQAHDPLLRVAACVGQPGCVQAVATTRPLARALAPHVPAGEMLHVSGCAKGCAHPADARTLVAVPGGFDLIRQGRASSPPDLHALPAEALALHLGSTATPTAHPLTDAGHAPPV